jgi:RecB family exonuclease
MTSDLPASTARPLAPIKWFSQASLQDYLDCRQRFYLRFLVHLAWPALAVEPVQEYERETAIGAAFHRLVQQHLAGVPADRLSAMRQEDEVAQWWQTYLDFAHPDLTGIRPEPAARLYPEISLAIPLAGSRLLAKYDLIVVHPNQRVTIFDWKTSRRLPGRTSLAARMQTRVYRYILVQAGAALNAGTPFLPEQIEMVYWFAGFSGATERFSYDARQVTRDGQDLAGLISEIQALKKKDFFLTPDERRCRFCTYRSLCDRGIRAGTIDAEIEAGKDDPEDQNDGLDTDLDFDQIAEIGY